MTVLYLVRHAIAEPRDRERWPDDAARPLTPEGEESFRRAANGLLRIVPSIDAVLTSPYARAWRTAGILHETAAWPAPSRCDALGAVHPPAEAIPIIRAHADQGAIALVGHEPYLTDLVSLLAETERLGLRLKKGGVVCLEVEGDEAALRWMVTPKILRALGSR
jgi:phosphohistidine phosphatase